MAVAVGLDDGHQSGGRTGDALQLFDVVCIVRQANFSPGYWMVQDYPSFPLIQRIESNQSKIRNLKSFGH